MEINLNCAKSIMWRLLRAGNVSWCLTRFLGTFVKFLFIVYCILIINNEANSEKILVLAAAWFVVE